MTRAADHRSSFGDFTCIHCGLPISTNTRLSGVINRNHCPYCLYSRHLDLHEGGDRLSPCQGPMRPVGLALKKTNKKYARPGQGELMLIHHCQSCGRLSINRIAADDDADRIYAVYQESLALDEALRQLLAQDQIIPLQADERAIVRRQLFGEI